MWCEHPEWDLSFLREAAREIVVEFNALLDTPLNDPPVEFVPPAYQSPQVINEDSPVVNAEGGGGVDKDDELVQIDNPTGVLSSEDHPLSSLN